MGPLAAAARRLSRHPRATRSAVAALEAVGAHTLADHLDRLRSDGDLVAVTVPAGPRALRSRRFRMHSLDDRDQVVRAIRRGGWLSFEAPLPSVVVQLVRRWPGTVLDIGANTGFYSLVVVTASRGVRAIACEPVPEVAETLRTNIDANPRAGAVEVHAVAVGDHIGPVALHLPPAQPDGTVETSASLEAAFKGDIARVLQVDGVTLDELWRRIGRPTVPLVKIDVEGAEPRVLAGAVELVDACRPVLTVEVLADADVDAIDAFCRRHDYVDVTLSEVEAVVGRPAVKADPLAPNHLLAPREKVHDLVSELGRVPRLIVTVL
ncbi:MAG: FkbM family methyltransferase [Acidimicrobiales bacterium]